MEPKVVRKVLRSLPKRFRHKVMGIKKNKDTETIKLKVLIDSLQTFEASNKVTTKNKGIIFKVEEPFGFNEDSDDYLALMAKKFKKFF